MLCPDTGFIVAINSGSMALPKPNLSEISPFGFFKAKELFSVIALSVNMSAESV